VSNEQEIQKARGECLNGSLCLSCIGRELDHLQNLRPVGSVRRRWRRLVMREKKTERKLACGNDALAMFYATRDWRGRANRAVLGGEP